MLGKKFYEKRFSPYPFPKSFLIFIRLYGVLYYHPKLATTSLDAFSPEGHIARDVRAYRTFVYRVCPRQTYRAELCEAFLPPKLATVSLVDKNGHHTVILSGGAYAP